MKQNFTIGWWAKLALSLIALFGAIQINKLNAQTSCPTPVVQNMALVPCSTGHKIQFQYTNTTGVTGSVNVSLGSGTNLKYQQCIELPVCSTLVTLSSSCFTTGTVFDTLFKVVYPFTNCQPCISLPVHFISFNAEKKDAGKIRLAWEVEISNEQNDYFKVERSYDGRNFSEIALVFTDPNFKKYSFTDNPSNTGKIYYRIVYHSNSGKKYSNVVLVSFEKITEIKPFLDGTGTLRVQGLPPDEMAAIVVIDLSGRILTKAQMQTEQILSNGIQVNNLATGIYVVNVTTTTKAYSGKFFKN